MKSIRSATITFVYALILSTSASAGEKPLTSAEILDLFPGQFEARFKSFQVMFAADRAGRMAGRAHGITDKGRWSLNGRQLCISWARWTRGEPNCGAIWKRGKWYVASGQDGYLRFRKLNVVAGN